MRSRNEQRLAKGYGYDDRAKHAQYNQVGNLGSVVATVAGNDPIATSSDYGNAWQGRMWQGVAPNSNE